MSSTAELATVGALTDGAAAEAAVLAGPKHYTTGVQTPPVCGPDEVLIRLEGCGICASSLPVWEGRSWFEYPLPAGAPGHEGWGYIADCGASVKAVQRGQRVACLAENAFATYVTAPEALVVPIPPALDGLPVPGEAIGCAMNIFRRADVRAGQRVAIIGAGFLGLLLTQLAVAQKAKIVVLSRRESVRRLALSFGANAAIGTQDRHESAQEAMHLSNGRGYERVIEVTGLQFALDLATSLIAEYGKLIIGGYHQDGLREINMQMWNWRSIDVINAHERSARRARDGMAAGIAAMAAGRIQPQALLTHAFALDRLDRAFAMMDERPDDFIKGWVRL